MWFHFHKRQSDESDVEMNGVSHSHPAQSPISRSSPVGESSRLHTGTLDRNMLEALKIDEIYDAAEHHVSYTFNGNTREGLDQYNNSKPYGLTSEKEKEFVRLEIRRLVDAAVKEHAYLFDGDQHFDTSPAIAFQEMSDIADQIKCAMGIVRLDNASISIQHCTNELEDTHYNFRHARSRLMGRFHPNQGRGRKGGPKQLLPTARNTALYHSLLDYMTATVARTIARTATSEYWYRHTLSCLAACTVKLKLLARDLENAAGMSIATAESALEEMHESNNSKENYIVKFRPGPYDEVKELDPLDMETDTSRRYHEEKTIFNKRVWHLLRQILFDLLRSETNSTASDCFQVHSTMFKAGVDSSQTIFSIGRLGEIEAATEPIIVKNSFNSMQLVMQNARGIEEARNAAQSKSTSTSTTAVNAQGDTGTTIECEWVDDSPQKKSWRTTLRNCGMNDVLSLMVPLSLARPESSMNLSMMLSMANSATDEEDPILQSERPPLDLRGFVTITTGKWRDKERTTGRWKDDDVMSLTEKRIRYGIRSETERLSLAPSKKEPPPDWKHAKRMADILQDYNLKRGEMKDWVIAEDSITISVRPYVSISVLIAFIVLCGGIAIPFVVRDRITGVDPFQITLFCWLVAGFIVLVAKGRYVNEWPWHEFLHGHVICCSLKEVCDATNINDQTVLMYLLLGEWQTVLRTRGPHNSMFKRRTPNGDGGFAINRPIHISTMMASGYLIVQVVNLFGKHLICLDTRKGNASINLRASAERLAYLDLEGNEYLESEDEKATPTSQKNKGDRSTRVKKLEISRVIVDRIIGAYVGDSYFG